MTLTTRLVSRDLPDIANPITSGTRMKQELPKERYMLLSLPSNLEESENTR